MHYRDMIKESELSFDNFISAVNTKAWAITSDRLDSLISLSQHVSTSKKEDRKTVKNVLDDWGGIGDLNGYGYEVSGASAIINIDGVIEKNFSLGRYLFYGMVSTEMLAKDILSAVQDDSIETIILNIDSPGGTIDGTKELSDFIYEIRRHKKIIAYGNGIMASGAYYIGSAAHEIYTYDTSYVGSIGVYRPHVDMSKMMDEFGIKITLIHAGKEKIVGNPYSELSDKDRDIMQKEVDLQYEIFIDTIARNRNVKASTVKSIMADGKIFIGQQAVDAGLVDGLANIGEVVEYANNNLIILKGEKNILTQTKEKIMGLFSDLTLDVLKDKYPQIYKEAVDVGKSETVEADEEKVSAQISDAVKIETQRAEGIFGLVKDAPELLGDALKLFGEGKSEGDVAIALFNKGAAKPEDSAASGVEDSPADGINEDPSVRWSNDAELCKAYKNDRNTYMIHMAAWKRNDKNLQDDFGGDLEAYLAYSRNV